MLSQSNSSRRLCEELDLSGWQRLTRFGTADRGEQEDSPRSLLELAISLGKQLLVIINGMLWDWHAELAFAKCLMQIKHD